MAIGAIFSIVKDAIFPVLDKVIIDKDKNRQLKHGLEIALIDINKSELEAATNIIVAEAKGESWLQRNWRPITMLFFVTLIGAYWVGLAPAYLVANPNVVAQLFEIVQFGLSGYVVGRSAEKIVETWKMPEKIAAKEKALKNGR